MPTGIPEAPLEERFRRRTIEQSCPIPNIGNCHIWTGAKLTTGYGQLTPKVWGTKLAHCWACHYWNKSPLPIEPGRCVRHKCDNKLCVNPKHLEYGTVQENIKDMEERNPTAFGRIQPTEDELDLLREMNTENIPRRAKAKALGHSRHWVDRVERDFLGID